MKTTKNPLFPGLFGTYTLVSLECVSEAGNRFHLFGEHPKGSIIYSPDGYMSSNIMSRDRPLSKDHTNFLDVSEAYARQIYQTYLSYSGSYSVECTSGEGASTVRGVIRHYLEVSYFPNWVGNTLERPFALEGDSLTLTAPEPWVGPDGDTYTGVIAWRRYGIGM